MEFSTTPDDRTTPDKTFEQCLPRVKKSRSKRQGKNEYPPDCILGKDGKAPSNVHNAITFLRFSFPKLVAFDEMRKVVMLMRSLKGEVRFEPRPLRKDDVTMVQAKLQRLGLVAVSFSATNDALLACARELSFNPVKEYLMGLKWDGKPRLQGGSYGGHRVAPFSVRYLGAELSEYTTEVTTMFWISMVARVFSPGIKADYMLVLEGEQGSHKGAVCRVIGGDYFADSLPSLWTGKEVSQYLRGKWLVEVPEMHTLTSGEVCQVKAFLTRTEERYRPSHEPLEVVEPRQCVFIGTTNKATYLKDHTGNRRFWPVKVGKIDLEATRRDRDQLFAEAVTLFRSGLKHWPSEEFEDAHIKREQEARRVTDMWEGPIRDYLVGKEKVRLCDIATAVLNMQPRDTGRHTQNRIMEVLETLRWVKGNKTGGNVYWYPSKPG